MMILNKHNQRFFSGVVMNKKCEHKNVSFLGVLHHLMVPEKCFICNDCEQLITDYISSQEMATYQKDTKMELSL